ncbi:hypothetical protein SAMN00808754_2248 [Thermanaeromonas toyohensis ToBE]|uniref:Uncharacterized protein n=1 Tax=Thermanaeromonas toyohensis ToBE TaxID=698762 RepID=A0A1W1VY65_9FIRM|nr:hypothetical protein [Thermanaeromonas toyohensis]SMB98288.1 hypothetical protein SAMN00808754_2248 [Thermanaeromonas toyohensis ToBE]
MRAQVTVTVAEAKRIIARAIAALPEVKQALQNGRILLKGGTTVSAVAEELAGITLRISGRVSPRGTKTGRGDGAAHSILLEKGVPRNIDDCFAEAVSTLGPSDVAIIGANAIDASGRAAIMLGRTLGGEPGKGLAGLMAQGCKVIIACGLEKLIPGSVDEAVRCSGIRGTDWSMGMAVGLVPLVGKIVTEKEALEIIARVKCVVIGKGGIDGAEGSTTMVVEGEPEEVEKAVLAVLAVKGTGTSGSPASLLECEAGSEGCRVHQACAWKHGKKGVLEWYVR